MGILEVTMPHWLCITWQRGDALHIAAIRKCLRHATL
jgi:hypothetical protein